MTIKQAESELDAIRDALGNARIDEVTTLRNRCDVVGLYAAEKCSKKYSKAWDQICHKASLLWHRIGGEIVRC